jgi:hypothetical protein
MKARIAAVGFLAALALLAGCATHYEARGPAYGQEEAFRQQLANSKPVREWACIIEDVRFSDDYRRADVVFGVPGQAPARRKVCLTYEEGEHAYTGTMHNLDLPRSNPLKYGEARAMRADIRISLPPR